MILALAPFLLAFIIPIFFITMPICRNFKNLAKVIIVLIGIPITLFVLSIIQVSMRSPEQIKAQMDEEKARIISDCSGTREQEMQWFNTHKGWAEHIEEEAECVRNHK